MNLVAEVNAILQEHGETMTLKREGEGSTIIFEIGARQATLANQPAGRHVGFMKKRPEIVLGNRLPHLRTPRSSLLETEDRGVFFPYGWSCYGKLWEGPAPAP